MVGVWTRLACIPFIVLLCVAMFDVHADWTIEQGQFGWLLMIISITLLLTGSGHYSLDRKLTLIKK